MSTGRVHSKIMSNVELTMNTDKYNFLDRLIDNAVRHNEPNHALALAKTMDHQPVAT